MRAGQLRSVIMPQTAILVGAGPTATWADTTRAYAHIESQPSQQFVGEEMEHQLTIRYFPGLSSRMRIKYGTRVLWIDSIVDVDQRHREMALSCHEFLWTQPASFARSAAGYNDGDGTFSGAPASAASKAIRRRGDASRLAALNLRLVQPITLTVDAEPLGVFVPAPDDAITFGNQTYAVRDVEPIAPDGINLAYTVTGSL
jgi:head-tail adaptor